MNNKINVTPVILCGGFGTRLWPMSRKGFPKQFMELSESLSLFQQTINRLTHIDKSNIQLGETLVITNEEHRFLALDQIKEISDVPTSLLLEPVGRNTAPALTFAALQATSNECDPILLVAPADQIIKDDLAFKLTIQINGKMRKVLAILNEPTQEQAVELAKDDSKIAELFISEQVANVIFIKGKVVNIILK